MTQDPVRYHTVLAPSSLAYSNLSFLPFLSFSAVCDATGYKDPATQLCESCDSSGFQTSALTSFPFLAGYVIFGLAILFMMFRAGSEHVRYI